MTAPAPHSQPTNPDVRQHAPLPWSYRPWDYDDWGFIRADDGSLAAVARGSDYKTHDEHRKAGTDPYGPNAAFIVEAVNSHASLKARVEELERDLADYKEAASVEADLRREFAGRVGLLEYSFRNVDELDWKHLLSFIPESGHGKFWKAVFEEVRAALSQSSTLARSPT